MSKQYQAKAQEAIHELETDPFSSRNVKRLHGDLEGLCRYRLGRFRMVFRVVEEKREVRILAIPAAATNTSKCRLTDSVGGGCRLFR